ncbi:hypothetical protein M408DRAFT_329192 [Serendipita vermifera MAFF 305830]|uniref:Nucleoside diphosphate kinase n=1 Tax=Serendipita vermifera MAFF 305830 TaxID=933852 RepID=A0A0C2WRE0_SERVB|nr:hypothetical protein M408DRAFT_329192 [Serendipita vermifera MAFF 305830]
MSGTSPHSPSSPANAKYPTRTVGIIKNHALKHRHTIERLLIGAGLDIIKERQMEFSADSDREVLEELFGNDAAALTEAPVWVYVLERHRAIETLQSLMGNEDPEVARQDEPHSIRAIYGIDPVNNAFGGSVDSSAAEAQIAALFASSPPFPTSDLPSDGGHDHDAILDEIRQRLEQQSDAAHYANSVRTSNAGSSGGTPTHSRENGHSNGKTIFRARPVPATNVPGAVQPRMTKAAALRMGISPDAVTGSKPRVSSGESLAGKRTFIDTPGHKRSTVISVASVAPPSIAPRATKASSLREGKPVQLQRRQSLDVTRAETFRGVPGHKRTDVMRVEVDSVKEPTVKPRTNRSASLRQTKDAAPPSSFQFKKPVEPKVPSGSVSRRSSMSSLAASDDDRKSGRASVSGVRPPSRQNVPTPASVLTPEIAPRSNRSAMLRAAKMAAAPAKPTRA